MSEQSKGVNVKTPTNFEDGIDHPNASQIHVSDGHLQVLRGGDSNSIAIYAPGQWISAVVNK